MCTETAAVCLCWWAAFVAGENQQASLIVALTSTHVQEDGTLLHARATEGGCGAGGLR